MQQASDFFTRLYSIRPFKQVDSPFSQRKTQVEKQQFNIKSYGQFKLPDRPIFYSPPKQFTTLRQVLCQHNQSNINEISDEANIMKNLSSTIDILFSKIEKIKSQFEYPLLKENKSTPQLINLNQDAKYYSFFSQQTIVSEDKQNDLLIQKRVQNNNASKKQRSIKKDSNIVRHNPLVQVTQTFNLSENGHENIQINTSFLYDGLKIKDFIIGKNIGSGKFGDVFLSMHKKTGFMCAIKKILKSTIIQYRMQEQFINQLKIHYRMNHPNIVKLYGHFDDQYHIFLMIQYANDGVLMDKLKSKEQFASKCIKQLLAAVDYLHKNKIMHRDIKPENIVIFFDQTIKLCDFGWASMIENEMKKTFCGTLDYISPEMKDIGYYNQSVDIWSIGVLSFQLLAGFAPYKHQINHWKLCGSKRSVKWKWDVIYPPQISNQAKLFIGSLLKQNPSQRASIRECKQSLFSNKYANQHPSFITAHILDFLLCI